MICRYCNQYKTSGIVSNNIFYCDETCKKLSGCENNLPKYVMIKNTAMTFIDDGYNGCYYRHAGGWSIGWQIVNGKLVTKDGPLETLNNIPIIEITEDEWKKDNGSYM